MNNYNSIFSSLEEYVSVSRLTEQFNRSFGWFARIETSRIRFTGTNANASLLGSGKLNGTNPVRHDTTGSAENDREMFHVV